MVTNEKINYDKEDSMLRKYQFYEDLPEQCPENNRYPESCHREESVKTHKAGSEILKNYRL